MRALVNLSRRRARLRVASACGVVLALAVAGCSSSGGSSGGSSNGKTTITELDYFTSSGGNTALNWYNKQFEAGAPRRHREADRGLLREPDHQGPAGRERRRHAEPRPARQPERGAGRGHRPAARAQRPARVHHQRLLPRRDQGVHLPGQAVLLPDRHELGGPVLQQGDAQSGRPPAAHDLGRAGRRRQEADQAAGLRDGLRRHRRRAVDLAARAVLLEQRGQPDQGGHACRSSRPCSCGSTWSRTARPPSPC